MNIKIACGSKMNTSVSILRQLVSFDTTSRNSNLQLIEWVADFLNSRGTRVELVFNPTRDKANLLASIGPERAGGVVLSGHTDVVPVDGQDWSSDPFALVERDGRLYGRGSSDMKGFIASSLAALENWKGMKLLRPLHFAFSYDEEIGCLGAHSLVDRIVGSVPTPAFAIIGEPTELRMRIGVAHNGVTGSHTSFSRGRRACQRSVARGERHRRRGRFRALPAQRRQAAANRRQRLHVERRANRGRYGDQHHR